MLKLTFALTRRPELTREAFQDYWFNTHAPLVASVRETLRIKRYVQMHSLPVEISEDLRRSRGGAEGYDGVAQLWWDSFDDLVANAQNEAAKAAGRLLLEDEARFIDLPKSPLWWGQEKVIF
ncbi:EthD domain-containing protein [Phenylobacterium sp.]|uniref:EthD domain-containing protein n=1 Tax=Phenylobacterium sp. TaxID=1871053 RepID=UPI002734089E|nr:EthD domain-containing protein [Phenylobacterium sp.]MDP3855091.1 EthD domain-containing protein [Phenylobacterium sp.]